MQSDRHNEPRERMWVCVIVVMAGGLLSLQTNRGNGLKKIQFLETIIIQESKNGKTRTLPSNQMAFENEWVENAYSLITVYYVCKLLKHKTFPTRSG